MDDLCLRLVTDDGGAAEEPGTSNNANNTPNNSITNNPNNNATTNNTNDATRRGGLVDMEFCICMAGYVWECVWVTGVEALRKTNNTCNLRGATSTINWIATPPR